jgi:tRNA A-37 threonylcarbamoyl transferase component Bud32
VVETGGVLLDRMVRTGACGTWWLAETTGGYPLGVLQLEPDLVAAPAARARAAAAVAAIRDAQPAGVLRTTELVQDAGRAWLVVASPPAPTVADLIAGGAVLEDGVAAGLALDVARALCALHSAGLSHGNLAVDTVIVTAGGSACLVEVGVLAALHDMPPEARADVSAWAQLARDLASIAPAAEAQQLLMAAASATQRGDLDAAMRELGTAQRLDTDSPHPAAATTGTLIAVDAAADPAGQARTRRPVRRRLVQVMATVAVVGLAAAAAVWWLLAR